MLRERRNMNKLRQYYQDFLLTGKPDNNVHPWVAASWLRSRQDAIPIEKPQLIKLSVYELAVKRKKYAAIIDFLTGMYQQLAEYLNKYNISMMLSDKEGCVLKNYVSPFLQNSWTFTEGSRILENDIGTSSMAIALAHKTPFLLFGPELWLSEFQAADSCSAPIIVDNNIIGTISLSYSEQQDLPYSAPFSLILSLKYSLEEYLKISGSITVMQTVLDTLPMAVYHLQPDSSITYANKAGLNRLAEICGYTAKTLPQLSSLILNYYHTPIEKGFLNIPAVNKEVTWITNKKTYEDITTVIPLPESRSVAAITTPIEDLKALLAHAFTYRARYTLAGMVGNSPIFLNMKERATRIARHKKYILLQGEAGTGKQRLAHGIHQASPNATGPFITLKCSDIPQELIEHELFGHETSAGKINLAEGGTLFLDEIEELPEGTAIRLFKALTATAQNNFNVIAACDSDLKRLTDRKAFYPELYELLAKTTLKVPSLRDRTSDIPIIAEHIIAELAEQHQLAEKQFSQPALEYLMTFEWAGNVKELQSAVEHAFFHTNSDSILPEDIKILPSARISGDWKHNKALFTDAWKAAGGNISRLAANMGVSRVTLYRYLKKFDLEGKNN